jgi:hypothetical protein
VKAPIAPDGDVTGRTTDLVINLDTSFDPSIAGRTLLAGKTIRLTLPEAFKNSEDLPLLAVGSSPECVPSNFQCNSAILLQGWPQHPIAPPFQKYALSYDGPNTIVVTALEDIVPSLPSEPGLKQIHLLLLSFTNPEPGIYEIEINAETGPAGALEQGVATVEILSEVRPSINVISVFNEGSPNTIYQATAPGELAPLPFDFLLWGQDGGPLADVAISEVSPDRAELVQGDRTVGEILIEAPAGASGYEVFAETPSSAMDTPITGFPTARMSASFRAGSVPGRYVLTFTLNGGNSVQMVVSASEPSPATLPVTGTRGNTVLPVWFALFGAGAVLGIGGWLLVRRRSQRA